MLKGHGSLPPRVEMPVLIYSPEDVVSLGAAEALRSLEAFHETDPTAGMRTFRSNGITLIETPGHHLYADHLDDLGADSIVVLSRHSSAKSVPSFTVHPVGNWTADTKIGGKPRELSTAAPVMMLQVLKSLAQRAPPHFSVTYEATHHGPFLRTPTLYAEVGGNEEVWQDSKMHRLLAEAVRDALGQTARFERIAVGIGGMHYESKFARLALEGKFAFGHMMPKHHAGELDMLGQAIDRCHPRPDVAVIEWKSFNSEERNRVIARLSNLGMDHVRV